MAKREYRYEVQRHEGVYEVHLEHVINGAVQDGGRLVNVDYGPVGKLLVIIEHKIPEGK